MTGAEAQVQHLRAMALHGQLPGDLQERYMAKLNWPIYRSMQVVRDF